MGNLMTNIRFMDEPDLEELALLNHTLTHGFSFLAVRILKEEHVQGVYQSGAGFYIGATDSETGEPVARDSVEYWSSEKEAHQALSTRSWTQRLHA